MDGFNEKKWFVYLTDHHEGPFSLADIQAKIAQNQVTVSNYVWAEGMGDWKPMTAIPEFESVLSNRSSTPPGPPLSASEPKSPATAAPTVMTMPLSTSTEEKTGDLDASDLRRAKETDKPAAAPSAGPPAKAARSGSRALKWGIVALVPLAIAGAYAQGYLDPVLQSPMLGASARAVGDFAQPHLLKLADAFPSLGKWISPIPSLDDISPEELESLKAAARPKLEESGPKLAVALSTADVFAPSFYVATNLPDGAVIDVYIEGVPDTLLNQLSFNAKAQATVDKKLGKTAPLRSADGKPLPRGEYVIYVTEGAQQPEPVKAALANVPPVTAKVPAQLPRGLKLLVSKPVFLGGAKDATYAARLKEYHDKLLAKSSAELAEVKQLATTLETQLGATVAKFTQLRSSSKKGKMPPAARKSWNEFHSQWASLHEQLRQSFEKWTPQALETEYFYGMLYSLTQQAGQAVEAVHALHQAHFDGKLDPKSSEIQLGTAMSVAQTAISALKTKVDQAEKLGPTPNGMPRREGL